MRETDDSQSSLDDDLPNIVGLSATTEDSASGMPDPNSSAVVQGIRIMISFRQTLHLFLSKNIFYSRFKRRG